MYALVALAAFPTAAWLLQRLQQLRARGVRAGRIDAVIALALLYLLWFGLLPFLVLLA
jgi:hypothetical protein